MLDIRRVYHSTAALATGVVIVIDVLRAFSVAAYAFAGGARMMWLVRSVEEAVALREREPEALLIGEVNGRLIPGFDFNNSPSQMAIADVHGRLLIQRTGAGTRGAVSADNAQHLLLSSLVNARATANYARKLAQETDGIITLFPTEIFADTDAPNEDSVCADYLEALLLERDDAVQILTDGIAYLHTSGRFDVFEATDADLPSADIPAVLATDRFDFAMVGSRQQWRDIIYVETGKVDI